MKHGLKPSFIRVPRWHRSCTMNHETCICAVICATGRLRRIAGRPNPGPSGRRGSRLAADRRPCAREKRSRIPGVTQPGTIQWLNPNAFVSAVDPSTGVCVGGDTPQTCQFGSLGRNALRGPEFAWCVLYITKLFPLTERVNLRFDAQFFNLFNHPNFGLPSVVYAGIPGKPSTQTGFGALTYTTWPPTGLLGVGLGGDSTPRMIAFQMRVEF